MFSNRFPSFAGPYRRPATTRRRSISPVICLPRRARRRRSPSSLICCRAAKLSGGRASASARFSARGLTTPRVAPPRPGSARPKRRTGAPRWRPAEWRIRRFPPLGWRSPPLGRAAACARRTSNRWRRQPPPALRRPMRPLCWRSPSRIPRRFAVGSTPAPREACASPRAATHASFRLLGRTKAGLARPERFELPTLGFEDRYSIQLSYGRVADPHSTAPSPLEALSSASLICRRFGGIVAAKDSRRCAG